MLVKQVKIRWTHRYSFRSGEFGSVIGLVFIKSVDYPKRLCYTVLYDDGVIDYIPIIPMSDNETYEIVGDDT